MTRAPASPRWRPRRRSTRRTAGNSRRNSCRLRSVRRPAARDSGHLRTIPSVLLFAYPVVRPAAGRQNGPGSATHRLDAWRPPMADRRGCVRTSIPGTIFIWDPIHLRGRRGALGARCCPRHRPEPARVVALGRAVRRHERGAAVRPAEARRIAGAVVERAGGADAYPPEQRVGDCDPSGRSRLCDAHPIDPRRPHHRAGALATREAARRSSARCRPGTIDPRDPAAAAGAPPHARVDVAALGRVMETADRRPAMFFEEHTTPSRRSVRHA